MIRTAASQLSQRTTTKHVTTVSNKIFSLGKKSYHHHRLLLPLQQQKQHLLSPSPISSQRTLVTAAQKRALNKDQLAGKEGGSKKGTAKSPSSSSGRGVKSPPAPPTAASTKNSGPNSTAAGSSGAGGASGDSGSGAGLFLPAAGLVGIAAGGAYYMDLFPKSEKEVEAPVSIKKEEKKEKIVVKKDSSPAEKTVESNDKKPEEKKPLVDTPTTSKKDVKEASEPKQEGNRVTQIHAPPKDTERVMMPPPPVQHAEDAHKVTLEKIAAIESSETTLDTNADTTDGTNGEGEVESKESTITAATAFDADEELNSKRETDLDLAKAHASLRANMDQSLFEDLDSLTLSQLRVRVVQLAAEMQERTKWEAVRLQEFLAIKEREVGEKYLEKMQKQRLEFEDLLARRLREQEDTLTKAANAAMAAKDESFQSVIDAAANTKDSAHELALKSAEDRIVQEINAKAEEEVGRKIAEMKEAFVKEMESKVNIIEKLTERLEKNEQLLSISRNFEDGSQRAHRVSAAALALAEKLETSMSGTEELASLKAAAVENGVIASALSKIPISVKSGVPTLSELQTNFESVYRVGRQAAFVPTGRHGLEGQIAGKIFSTVSVPPSSDSLPPSEKDASDSEVADYALARAKAHVQLGDLEEAVKELEKLKGQAAFVMKDWKKDASDRLAVEKALKVIKMECALMNKNMAG